MSEIIRTHGLKERIQNEIAVKHLDFVLQSGEICAFIGKKWGRKIYFFKMLSGQIQPTTGELQLFGMTDKDLLDARKKIWLYDRGTLSFSWTLLLNRIWSIFEFNAVSLAKKGSMKF